MVTLTRVTGMRYSSVRGGCHRQADWGGQEDNATAFTAFERNSSVTKDATIRTDPSISRERGRVVCVCVCVCP